MSFSGKQTEIVSKVVSNNGFYPDLDVAEFITLYRTPADLPQKTVEDQLLFAMIQINKRLETYRNRQEEIGILKLEDVAVELLGGVSVQISLYKRAVFSQAKAAILRDWPSVDRRSAGENLARSGEETEDHYLSSVDQTIAVFLGLGGINVDLI